MKILPERLGFIVAWARETAQRLPAVGTPAQQGLPAVEPPQQGLPAVEPPQQGLPAEIAWPEIAWPEIPWPVLAVPRPSDRHPDSATFLGP